MINVQVRLFAAMKELLGKDRLDLSLGEGSSLENAVAEIAKIYPEADNILSISRFAINMEYSKPEAKLSEGDEITVIMPVSGGAQPLTASVSGSNFFIEITAEKIDAGKTLDFVSDDSAGSVLLFNGTVRNNEDGKRVRHLFYEAYGEMALKELKKLADAAFDKFDIIKVSIIHRTGKIDIGEISISIGVSSAHREDSYKASRFLIDNIKETVPIWKKESFGDFDKWKRI